MLNDIEIIKFLVSFSIIIIFIYALYYYLNRYGFNITSKKSKNIKIIETTYFSKNRGFLLVEVKDKIFFLSFDENGIKKIKEWSDEKIQN